MAKGYWIGRVDVANEEAYKPYSAANAAIFRKYGGRFVVRAGKRDALRRRDRMNERAPHAPAGAGDHHAHVRIRCRHRDWSPVAADIAGPPDASNTRPASGPLAGERAYGCGPS